MPWAGYGTVFSHRGSLGTGYFEDNRQQAAPVSPVATPAGPDPTDPASSTYGGAAKGVNALPGGGVSVPPQLGMVRSVDVPIRVSGAFLGMNMGVDPMKLSEQETPWCVNWNGWLVPGSVSVRRGLAKADKHLADPYDANDAPVGMVSLGFRTSDGYAAMVMVGQDGGVFYNAVKQSVSVPRTGLPLVAPVVSSLASSGGEVTFTIAEVPLNNGIAQYYVALRAGSDAWYPSTPWVDEERGLNSYQVFNADWTGIGNVDVALTPNPAQVPGLVNGAAVWVSVWIATRLGFSPAWRGRVTFAT